MTRTVNRRTRALAKSLGLLMLALASSHAAGAERDPFEALGVLRPAEPLAAPDFPFRSLDGREARLGHLRGKVVLVGFLTTW
jgi:cytochrome oxidase Cu insertion factor (SCO1/SenC/PrrC family)